MLSWLGLAGYSLAEGKWSYALRNNVVENPVFTTVLAPEDIGFLEQDGDGSGADGDNAGMDGSGSGAEDGSLEMGGSASDTGDGSGSGLTGGQDATADGGADGAAQGGTPGTGKTEPDGGQGSGADTEDSSGQEAGRTVFKKRKKQRTDSPYYTDPGKTALTTEYDYKEVDKSYFDDAVFIGDSRTVGMQDYSGLDNATFFAKTGLNVYEVLDDEFIKDPKTGKDVSVSYMLKHYQYGKIYFMIGINELGTGNTGTFQKAYAHVLKKFRQWQPQAVIYIQGIIAVSGAKSAEDGVFNNININDKNVAIAQLADGVNIFYLDINPKLTDKDGNLKADYTFDEIHMYAQYYDIWTKFLTKHAVVRDESAASSKG